MFSLEFLGKSFCFWLRTQKNFHVSSWQTSKFRSWYLGQIFKFRSRIEIFFWELETLRKAVYTGTTCSEKTDCKEGLHGARSL